MLGAGDYTYSGHRRLTTARRHSSAHATTLGTKTIAVDNAHATIPFGNIDTPGQGATATGAGFNFGWALTPNRTPACSVPAGGVQVSIDSGPLQAVTYGGARADITSGF